MDTCINLMTESFNEWLSLDSLIWLDAKKMRLATPYRILDVTFNPKFKADTRELVVYVDSTHVGPNRREAFTIRGSHNNYTMYSAIRSMLNCGLYDSFIILIRRDEEGNYDFDFNMKPKSDGRNMRMNTIK